jgi:hypothetical protein
MNDRRSTPNYSVVSTTTSTESVKLKPLKRMGGVANFTLWSLCLHGKRSHYALVRKLLDSQTLWSQETENRTPFRRPSSSWPSRYTEARRPGTCALFKSFQLQVRINTTERRIYWKINARSMESVNTNVVK